MTSQNLSDLKFDYSHTTLSSTLPLGTSTRITLLVRHLAKWASSNNPNSAKTHAQQGLHNCGKACRTRTARIIKNVSRTYYVTSTFALIQELERKSLLEHRQQREASILCTMLSGKVSTNTTDFLKLQQCTVGLSCNHNQKYAIQHKHHMSQK